jgi:predicted phage terminase large subunit-like protein
MNIEQLAALAKYNFYIFPKLASNNKIPKHIKFIGKKIQKAIEKKSEKNRMLIISIPPRHGKSELISKHLPPWYLGTYPENRIILTSYSSELSDKHSDYAKDIFAKWGPYLWNVHPSKSTYNRAAWDTEKYGGCISAGVGGSITGFGADLLLIDDYVKGHEEAESKTQREKLWNWWQTVASSRLHPNSVVVILCTRWHTDDLSGRLIKQKKEEGEDFPFDFEYINLPAIAEENDPIGRQPGEALWPERFSAEQLLNVKKTSGSHGWATLWQGHPSAIGGMLYKSHYFRYFTVDWQTSDYLCYPFDQEPIRVPKSDLRIIVTVDPSLETKTRNDPAGMLAWGYARKCKLWLLLDALKGKFPHEKMIDIILNFAFKNRANEVFVENEKIGKVLVKQSAGNDKIQGLNIPFKEVATKNKDKFSRNVPMASYVENQRVYFNKNAPWLAEYENDLCVFPDADDDCWADCTGYATVLEKRISVAEVLANAMKRKK